MLHTVITEPVEAHNTDLRFIERITVIGNTVHQCIKLLFCAVPVKRFGEFYQNCVTAILKSEIKNINVLPFCVLRDVKRQFLYLNGVTYRVWSVFEGQASAAKSLSNLMLRRLETGDEVGTVTDEFEEMIQRKNSSAM